MWTLAPDDRYLAATLMPGVPAGVGLAGLHADAEAWRSPPGLTPAQTATWMDGLRSGAWAAAIQAERAALQRHGASILDPRHADWPPGSLGVLRMRGALARPALAIVGARRADPYGREVATRVAQAAVAAGLAVVSGGAFGVDAAAHRATLDAGGRTVVVLGAGLDHAGPVAHRGLFERAATQGALVSPFPCGFRATRWSFPHRNQWIARLADGVVVVQAGARSGALHTARAALAMGRPVWTVPGPMEHPLHAGCHALVGAGAALLTTPDAWRAVLAPQAPASDRPRRGGPASPGPLWSALSVEPTGLAVLARRAGLSVGEAAAAALQLELDGWIRSAPGGRYARVR